MLLEKKNWVRAVGQCFNIRANSYELTFLLEDSTGAIECKIPVVSSDANCDDDNNDDDDNGNNDDDDGDGCDTNNAQSVVSSTGAAQKVRDAELTSKRSSWILFADQYVCVVGVLSKSLTDTPQLVVSKVEKLYDMNQITYHLLSAMVQGGGAQCVSCVQSSNGETKQTAALSSEQGEDGDGGNQEPGAASCAESESSERGESDRDSVENAELVDRLVENTLRQHECPEGLSASDVATILSQEGHHGVVLGNVMQRLEGKAVVFEVCDGKYSLLPSAA